MDQKNILLSALSVGVGVGLGLASGQTLGRWTGYNSSVEGVTADQIELEIRRLIVDGKDSKVTFDEFPYFLSERTRVLLTNAAYVHLKHLNVSKHTQNLLPASRAILFSGPAELYHQMLAKALSHYFEAKLLLLDVNDLSLKIQSKYGSSKKESSFKRSISDLSLGRMSSLLGSFSSIPPREDTGGINYAIQNCLLLAQSVKSLVEKKQGADEAQTSADGAETKEGERVITLRPLNMEDMRQAKNQVAASFATEGSVMSELKQWNELYGEGGSLKKRQLTYFL